MTTSGRNSFSQYFNPCCFKSKVHGIRGLIHIFLPRIPEPSQDLEIKYEMSNLYLLLMCLREFCFDSTNNFTKKNVNNQNKSLNFFLYTFMKVS